tara:strand:- start:3 stop:611 length:609 start_codon:yes stop_codon:yes gene_type:complete
MEELSCWTRKRNDGSNYTVCQGLIRETKQSQLNALKRQYSLKQGMEERDRQAEKSLAEGEDIVATAKKRLDRLGGDKRLAEVKAELAGMKEKDRQREEEAEEEKMAGIRKDFDLINKDKLITAIEEIQELIPVEEDNVSIKWNSGRGGWKHFRRKRKELRREQLEDIDKYMLFNIMKYYLSKFLRNEKYKKQLEKIVGDTQR